MTDRLPRRRPGRQLVHRRTARDLGPVMATAATTVVAQVDTVVETGAVDPEVVVTPGEDRGLSPATWTRGRGSGR